MPGPLASILPGLQDPVVNDLHQLLVPYHPFNGTGLVRPIFFTERVRKHQHDGIAKAKRPVARSRAQGPDGQR